MRFQVKKVEPTGFHVGAAFVTQRVVANGTSEDRLSGVELVTSEAHPDSPEGVRLRALRSAAQPHVSMGQAARRLGMTVTQYSGLETGRYTFLDPVDWETAAEVITGKWPRRADEWPFCPVCNEDELWCPALTGTYDNGLLTGQDRLRFCLSCELRCYRCSKSFPGGTFTTTEVGT